MRRVCGRSWLPAKKREGKGLKVGVGLQRRHEASYLENVKKLQDGEIGKILCLRS